MSSAAQTVVDPYAAYGGSIAAPAQAASQSVDPYAAYGGQVAPTAEPSESASPDFGSQVWEGVKQAGQQIGSSIVKQIQPAQTPTETVLEKIAGPQGLMAYRAAKGVVDTAKNIITSVPETYEQTAGDFQQAVADLHHHALRSAISSGLSAASDIGAVPGGGVTREIAQNLQPGGNVVTPVTRDALLAAAAVLGAKSPEIAEAASEPIAQAASTAADTAGNLKTLIVNPFKRITQVLTASPEEAGARAMQTPAGTAIRQGVQAAADTTGVTPELSPQTIANSALKSGNQTILDEPLKVLAGKEKAAYQQIDETVGFDLKELKQQLQNDQYNLQQLGNTPADQAQRTTLQTAITDAQTRIGEAEKKLQAAGIDPASGDALHKMRMAGEDLKNSLVKSIAPNGDISVNSLLKRADALRFSKRGDRLAQLMGQDGADQFIADLQKAKATGAAAITRQRLIQLLPRVLGWGGLGYEAARGLLD